MILKPSLFIIQKILDGIKRSGGKARFTKIAYLASPTLRSERRLEDYLSLLLELGWLSQQEEKQSTLWNPILTRRMRTWNVAFYHLTKSGQSFLSLFPKDVAEKVLPKLESEDEGIPSPEEQQRNYDEWLVSGPAPEPDL